MSDAKRRDDFVARVAASALAGDAPAEGCPDAGRLAEWHEARPGSPAREILAAHLASCARCQAVLATLARIDDEVQAPAAGSAATVGARVGSASLAWRWLLPAGAALAAVTVWFVVGPPSGVIRPPAVSDAPATRLAEAQAPAASALPVEPPEPSGPKPGPRGRSEAPPASRGAEPPQKLSAKGEATPLRTGAEAAPVLGKVADRVAGVGGADALAVPVETRPAAEAARPAVEEVRAPSAAARDNRLEAKAVAARGLQLSSLALEFASADRTVSWRVGPGNRVARSIDGGRSWQGQNLDRSFTIRAGSAASREVCWLAGSGGLVLLTVDGITWTRLAPPTDADLVEVEGQSALAATVVSSDGRRFATGDGGRTWEPRR